MMLTSRTQDASAVSEAAAAAVLSMIRHEIASLLQPVADVPRRLHHLQAEPQAMPCIPSAMHRANLAVCPCLPG